MFGQTKKLEADIKLYEEKIEQLQDELEKSHQQLLQLQQDNKQLVAEKQALQALVDEQSVQVANYERKIRNMHEIVGRWQAKAKGKKEHKDSKGLWRIRMLNTKKQDRGHEIEARVVFHVTDISTAEFRDIALQNISDVMDDVIDTAYIGVYEHTWKLRGVSMRINEKETIYEAIYEGSIIWPENG